MSPARDDPNIIDVLTEEVTETKGVMQSAVVLITGINDRVTAGIAAARAGDFTRLTALEADLQSGKEGLAAAVAANQGDPSTPGDIAITNAGWDENQRALSKPGAFASYTHDVNYVFIPNSGTGINADVAVAIGSKPSDDTIILDGSIGAGANGMTDIGGVIRKVTPEIAMRARSARRR